MKRRRLKTLVFACILLLAASIASPNLKVSVSGQLASEVPPPEGEGPYTIGWLDTNINKTGGATLPISIYYPSLTVGQNSQPDTSLAPYPTLLYSLGFLSTIDTYRNLASQISSWGFIILLVGTSPMTWNPERANDVVDALNWIDDQNDNASFALGGIVDESRFGVMGHSLGGEAALIVAQSDPRIKATVPIAPFSGSFGLTPNIHFPLFIIVGSDDVTAPPATMAYPLYAHGSSPKFCVTVMGQGHLSIILTCSRYIIQFLEFCFYGNEDYATYLYGFEAQKEVQNGTIRLSYDLRKTFYYEVAAGPVSYNVSVYSDSAFLQLSYNETENELSFNLEGPAETTGTANISIPTLLVKDMDIITYYDGKEYPFALTSDSTFHFVYLIYNHSQHELAIDFVDLTPPVLDVVSPSSGSVIQSPNVEVEWSRTDSVSGVAYCQVKVDEKEWVDVGTTTSYVFNGLSDGNHTVYVKAFDNAGNSDVASAEFMVDTTPPSVSIISPVDDSVMNDSSVVVRWTVEDAMSGIKYVKLLIDEGGQWTDVSNSTMLTLQGLNDGEHDVLAIACDNAGNVNEAYTDFVVDTLPPSVSILLPAPESKINSSNVTVTWKGADNASGIDHFEAKLDDGMWVMAGAEASYMFTELTNGNHTVYLKAIDKAGNLSENHVRFEVDAPSPSSSWMQWWLWAFVVGIIVLILAALTRSLLRRSLRSGKA